MIPSNTPFKTVKPLEIPSFGKLIIAGASGIGKTHFAGTAGKDAKVLVLDSERGDSTFRSKTFLEAPEASQIEVVRLAEGDYTAPKLVHEIEQVFDYLIRSGNTEGYKAVVLDSATDVQEKFLAAHNAPDKRQSYGALRDSMYALVSKVRAVPVHVIFLTRLKVVEDEVSKREIVRPELSPGLFSVIGGLFDAIGFMDVKVQGVRSTRQLDFGLSPRYQGKDRFGIGAVESPTLAQVLAVIEGNAPAKPAAPAKAGFSRR